jgi:hypothetical protein
VNVQGGDFGNALQVASRFWPQSIVRILRNKIADMNASGSEKGNALQVAARCVRRASFGCYWRKGQTNEFYSSGLCAAARCAHENIIQLLLVNGPRVGAPEGKFCSTLLVGASDGHESTIGLLLEKGPT